MRIFLIWVITFFLSISTVRAEILSFNQVIKKAIKNSYDLQISKIDINISEAGIKEARSEYFPVLNVGYNAGYDRDLSNSSSAITPVGDSILLNNTRYQNSASVSLQYNLFDFGIRSKKLSIAKKDKTEKQTRYFINLRDLKLSLADLYTKILLDYKEYSANKELLKLNTKLFSMQERLFNAGKNPKTDVMEQALKVARLNNKIDQLRTDFRKNLEDLSFYTGDKYNIDNITLLYMDEPGFEPVNFEKSKAAKDKNNPKLQIQATKSNFLDIETLPEYKYYQLEIEKKQAELSVLSRQRLPRFDFSTNYYLYGSNTNNFFKTFSDMGQTNLSFRIASRLPVFDGLKNSAQRQQAKLEIEKLKKQRDQKVAQMKSYYQKIYNETMDYSSILSNQEKSLKLVEDKIAMLDRMNEQKLIDQPTYLRQKTDLISQKLELEKVKINNDANIYKLKTLKKNQTKKSR